MPLLLREFDEGERELSLSLLLQPPRITPICCFSLVKGGKEELETAEATIKKQTMKMVRMLVWVRRELSNQLMQYT